MIEAATKVQDGSPDQYVLLKIAADIAATAGDAPTAVQAVEGMAERFDVPGPKLTSGNAAGRRRQHHHDQPAQGGRRGGVEDRRLRGKCGGVRIGTRACANRPSRIAQKARQYPLVKESAAKIDDFQKRQRAFQEYQAAWALMQDDPARAGRQPDGRAVSVLCEGRLGLGRPDAGAGQRQGAEGRGAHGTARGQLG